MCATLYFYFYFICFTTCSPPKFYFLSVSIQLLSFTHFILPAAYFPMVITTLFSVYQYIMSINFIVSKKILWVSFIFLCGFLFSVRLTAMLMSCWVTDFFITEIACLSFLRSLNLICLISIDTLAFFWLVFALYIFFLPPIYNLSLSLYLKLISEREHNWTYFTTWSDNFCF